MRFMKQAVFAGLMALSGVVFAQQGYETLSSPAPTDSAEGKVEVIEFFWYGCPHCNQFAPVIHDWEKNDMPDNVEFKLVAPALNGPWRIHSRAYYAAEALGVIEKFHMPMFDAIHKDGKKLDDIDSIAQFAGSLGINAEEFKDAMKSFAVETKMRRAMQLARAYRIGGVPSIGVAGKYKTNATLAQGHPNVIKVINELVAKESGS